MAKINQELFRRLRKKLGVSKVRVYQIIDEKVRRSHLPRHLAAIVVASDRGVNISKYASEADLAAIRSAAATAVPSPVTVPGSPASQKPPTSKKVTPRQQRRGTSVFVVHGRNDKARRELFTFLRCLNLRPLEWNEAIKKTRQANPYVGTILDTAFREAAAVVVLLTPDDDVRLRTRLRKAHDPEYERRLTGQARPNVIFEAGMAIGRNPENTVLVQLGEIKPFSDVAGRHILRLSNSPASRREFATKLANAGCNVNTHGTDWLDVGDLSP